SRITTSTLPSADTALTVTFASSRRLDTTASAAPNTRLRVTNATITTTTPNTRTAIERGSRFCIRLLPRLVERVTFTWAPVVRVRRLSVEELLEDQRGSN